MVVTDEDGSGGGENARWLQERKRVSGRDEGERQGKKGVELPNYPSSSEQNYYFAHGVCTCVQNYVFAYHFSSKG